MCYLSVIEEMHSVNVNNVLLPKLLYFLPVDRTNECPHNVLELYNMFTHFPFG